MPLLRAAALCCLGWLLTACGQPAAHPDEAAVRTLLERYFATWSARDMDGYGACFLPQARVTFVGAGGRTDTQGLTDFLHGQKLSHAQSPVPMHEAPTRIGIHGDPRVAQAEVRWRLTKGAQVVTGSDFFTLVKTADGWRIIALVFYND